MTTDYKKRGMGRRVISAVMLLALAFLSVIFLPNVDAHAQTNEVAKARIGVQNKSTLRFVLESSERLKPVVSYLADPDRIVIDLPPVEFSLGPGINDGTRFIESYRYGAFSNSVSRLVIDLKQPARVKKSFAIKPSRKTPNHRYVFDIALTSQARFSKEVARTAKQLLDPGQRSVEPVLSAAARNGDRPVIAIDAGHGGNDPGTMGVNGKAEKGIALSVARQLYTSLKATGQFTPVMTRDRDIYVDLRRRVEIARANQADLMLSLHADSIGNRNLRGGTIYTLSEKASDEEAAALAAKENKADIIAGIDLDMENPFVRDILITLAQRESKNFSVKFANILIDEMGGRRLIPKRPHRYAGFVVLKAPDVPSVLVEMGYLSNAADAARLSSKQGQTEIVRALTEAIEVYFSQLEIN